MGKSPVAADALEARFGLRATALLTHRADSLPRDVTERLRVARQQAVAIAARQLAAAPELARSPARLGLAFALPSGRGHGDERQGASWWTWFGSALPVLVLLVGLLGIDHWQQLEQIATAADIDVALLGDDLPPAAFTDPGFAEFLQEPVTADTHAP
ncbi:MAG: DUF3619 family protein [Leptothrix sp. (in: b-proteobacteria)]